MAYTPSHPDLFSVGVWMSGGLRKNCPKGWKCRGPGAMGAVCMGPASTLDSGCATKPQNNKHFWTPGALLGDNFEFWMRHYTETKLKRTSYGCF